jgi:hypothetical protein
LIRNVVQDHNDDVDDVDDEDDEKIKDQRSKIKIKNDI